MWHQGFNRNYTKLRENILWNQKETKINDFIQEFVSYMYRVILESITYVNRYAYVQIKA